MDEPIRILILEDMATDAELMRDELQAAGLTFNAKGVMTEADFLHELQEFSPELILSDYDLPHYNGALALVEARKRCPDVPFILVTGAISEEQAIDTLTNGAQDYVMKSRIQKLVPAVRRALGEAEKHRARQKLEAEREQLLNKLNEQWARLEMALRAAGGGTWDWNIATGHIEWSSSLFELFGLDPRKTVASFEVWNTALHDEDREAARSRIDRALMEQTDLNSEYRIVRPDGQILWVNALGQGIYDTQGRSVRMTGICIDITARKRAEAEREQSLREAKLNAAETEAIFAAQNDAMLIYDTEMNVRRVNSAFLATYGFNPVGLNVKEINHRVSCRWLDGRPFIWEEQPTPRALRGEKVTGALFVVTRADGTEGIVETSSGPMRERDRITGSVTVWHDVTGRMHTREALDQSYRRLEVLSETSSRLLASRKPQQIINELCHKVMAYLECHVFFNYLVDDTRDTLHLNAYAGIPEEAARKIEWLAYDAAVCEFAARDAGRIVAENISETDDPRTERVRSFGIKAYVCHPLFSEGRVIGTLSFGTRTRPTFTENELALMKTVTDQVSIAMERIRYIKNLKALQADLERSRDELEAKVSERTMDLEAINWALQAEVENRKQAQEELRVAVLYTRSLIEASLDPLVTISADGKIMDANKATKEVTGLSKEKLILSDFSDYFTEPEKAHAAYQRVFSEGFVRDYPLVIRHTTGRLTHVLYNASLYKDEAGKVHGVFAAARDITELRASQKALQQSHDELEHRVKERTADLEERTQQLEDTIQELESFSYSVSHDLKAPLRAIDGFSRMLLRKYEGQLDEDATRRLRIIRSNAQMMGELIDDLLTFSRLSRIEMKTGEVDMGKLIGEVWREIREEIREANLDREFDFRMKVIHSAIGDASLMRQVLFNLLSNAVKFTKDRRPAIIEVTSCRQGSEIVYSAKDNGVGFDMQYADKLFGVFQRLHSAEEYEGTGVGLAIAQRIIYRHGGRVWAESKVNEGATFYFTLPYREVH